MTDEGSTTPTSILGLRVFDVNGFALGRVGATSPDGTVSIDLSERARRRFETDADRLRVDVADFVDVDDHEVTLREEGHFLLHPEERPVEPVGD